jgi:Starch-binding associating with outer membrane
MKKISILFLSILGLIVTGCDNKFEEINTDPNNPLKVPAHLLLGNIVRVNQNTIYGMQQGGDMGMCWAQHASKVQYNAEERYIPRRGAIDGVWDNIYSGVISDAKTMYTFAETEKNKNLQGIALVLQANGFQILTDLYGPVPYTEAFIKGNITPKYDSQEVVYNGILDMLTRADALLDLNNGTIVASSDLVFGGDAVKWKKLANSLKLKALMRISKKRSVGAEIQALVNAGNLMSSNSDSAQLIYKAAQPDANPIYETIVFGTRKEYKISSVLANYMSGLNDPRLNVFASPIASGAIVGNIPGQENPNNYNDYSGFGTKYLDATLPGVILSNAQVQFLLAEAANEGYIAGGQTAALSYYNAGIISNFTFNGASGAATYIAQPIVTFTTQADGRKKIAEQNWVALFGQGFEAWTEWRRTGFPALTTVVLADVATIPSRLFYNSTEQGINSTNYNAAIASLTGGDKLTSRLWWMN